MTRLFLTLLLIGATACGVPRDPEGTLQRIAGGELRAGYTQAHPWSYGPAEDPQGVEVDLVEAFAEAHDAQVVWTDGSEAELLKALEVRALDLVVGGFDAKNPAVAATGVTRPYATSELVVGVAAGEAPLETLEGVRVSTEAASEAEGLLRKANAVVEPVDDITQATPPAAVEEWLLDDLDLTATDHVLTQTDHVMAGPPGENAFLVALERFLHEQSAAIDDAIAQAGPE